MIFRLRHPLCAAGFFGAVLLCASAALASETVPAEKAPQLRTRIEWTRLITPSQFWHRHVKADHVLIDFITKNTPLQVAPDWSATSPQTIEGLCRYPFVYAHDLSPLPKSELSNVAEFLRRGGFVLVDFCVNKESSPAPEQYFLLQIEALKPHLPELKIAQLPADHEVYSVYFKLQNRPPQVGGERGSGWVSGKRSRPLTGLFLGTRMVGIIALNGLECAWAGFGDPENGVECMQMVTNIHIYAMTH